MAAKLIIEKRGDEIKKKSSPLKLLSQSQPNFAEMIHILRYAGRGWGNKNIPPINISHHNEYFVSHSTLINY
jgi:hypothetical protein